MTAAGLWLVATAALGRPVPAGGRDCAACAAAIGPGPTR